MMREHELNGDLRVELHRMPARFGVELYVIATNNAGDVTHTAMVDDAGELNFIPYHRGTVVPPLFHVSERLLSALKKAFDEVPAPSNDATRVHLEDTITVRDRLLRMIEGQQEPSSD
jgi:hypothetical protein